MTDIDTALDDDIGDELLSLLFASCHPALSTEARVTLTLRLFGGLTTNEIARALLSSEPRSRSALYARSVRSQRRASRFRCRAATSFASACRWRSRLSI